MSTTAAGKPERPKKRQVQIDLCRYDHARLQPSQGLAAGLYTPLPSGPRRNRLVSYPYNEMLIIEHRCWEAFGADDLRLHLAVLAMRGNDCRRLSPEPKSEIGSSLRSALDLRGEAAQQDAATVRCSLRELAEVAGVTTGGRMLYLLYQGLTRGAADSITIRRGKLHEKHFAAVSAGNAMSFAVDKNSGQLVVALHPLLAQALLDTGAPYRRIDLTKMRALGTDAACILFTYLSAWLRPGERQIVGVDTLATHTYGGPASSPDLVRYRRREIRRALENIAAFPDWTLRPAPDAKTGASQVEVRRRKTAESCRTFPR